MGPLSIFLIIFLCCFFVDFFAKKLFNRLFKSQLDGWRTLASILFWIAILPVIDEIVGKSQFRQLCNDPRNHSMDWGKIRGKTVYVDDDDGHFLSGTVIPIEEQRRSIHDTKTYEEYGFYNSYYTEGSFWSDIFLCYLLIRVVYQNFVIRIIPMSCIN